MNTTKKNKNKRKGGGGGGGGSKNKNRVGETERKKFVHQESLKTKIRAETFQKGKL